MAGTQWWPWWEWMHTATHPQTPASPTPEFPATWVFSVFSKTNRKTERKVLTLVLKNSKVMPKSKCRARKVFKTTFNEYSRPQKSRKSGHFSLFNKEPKSNDTDLILRPNSWRILQDFSRGFARTFHSYSRKKMVSENLKLKNVGHFLCFTTNYIKPRWICWKTKGRTAHFESLESKNSAGKGPQMSDNCVFQVSIQ